jgi:hypothetical protein
LSPITSNNRRDIDDRIHYWIPRHLKSVEVTSREMDLKVAGILGSRLYHGLKYECELLILTEENWQDLLNHSRPDILIVESCRQSYAGDWRFAQSCGTDKNKLLIELLEFAKKKNIPLVYWNTSDSVYHSYYGYIASYFDYVFCADPEEVSNLSRDGISALELLPAIQPKIHNAIKNIGELNESLSGVYFDGWSDLLRYRELANYLEVASSFNLVMIDSKSEIDSRKLSDTPEFKANIAGCVDYQDRLAIIRNATAVLTFDESLKTKTEMNWDSLEVLASRIPIVHIGSLPKDDFRKKYVLEVNDSESLEKILHQLTTDYEYYQRLVHHNWRKIYKACTYQHRLTEVCNVIGIDLKREKSPLVTVILPTHRPQLLEKNIEMFQKQTYLEKELVVVINSSKSELGCCVDVEKYNNIKILFQPADMYAGACLNVGLHTANGKYCLRMDDDDYYGPNYISDMMLHLKSVDADVFGKPPSYIYFEEDDELYARDNNKTRLSILNNEKVIEGHLRLSGNSIGAKTDVLKKCEYRDTIFGSADTEFLVEAASKNLKIYAFDDRGLVACRRSDSDSHTWRDTKETLQKNARLVQDFSLKQLID